MPGPPMHVHETVGGRGNLRVLSLAAFKAPSRDGIRGAVTLLAACAALLASRPKLF